MGQGSKFACGVSIACFTTAMVLVLVSLPGYAQDAGQSGQSGQSVAGPLLGHQIGVHDQTALAEADPVDRQLAQYARRLPEVGFIRLYGEKGAGFANKLLTLLGQGAINLDYEHDESSRSTLLQLQMNRIGIMVKEGLPSATLFKVGKGSVFEHPYLCVISLDADLFRQDPGYATRFLSPGSGSGTSVPHEKVVVDTEDFLRFTVDHEVFHCLDAYFNGPTIKKTSDAVDNHYQKYLNEARADAFASQAFMRTSVEPEKFLKRFAALRTLSLLDFDLPHFTGEVVLRSLESQTVLPNHDIEQEVAASRELADDIAPSAHGYGVRMASTAHLIGELGIAPGKFLNTLKGQKLPPHDDSKVLAMLHELEQAQKTLEKDSGQGWR